MRITSLITPALLATALAFSPVAFAPQAFAKEPGGFSFENVYTIPQLVKLLREGMPKGTSRVAMKRLLIVQGDATPSVNPLNPSTERYIYRDDIKCWNVSADYDANGNVRELYVNGMPAYADAQPDPFEELNRDFREECD